MRKMKKFLAILLASTMTLGMTMTASAETSNKTIKVTLPVEGATVTYDKVIEEDRTSTLGWKVVDGYETAFVNGFLGESTGDEETVISSLKEMGSLENDNNNLYSVPGTINDKEALGSALDAVKNSLGESATVEGKEATIEVDTIGLYVVKIEKEGYTFIPMAVYVSPDFAGVTVTAKGAEDKVDKSVAEDGQTVMEGDKVTYTVEVEYPYYSANASNPKFVVTDTLENATFEEDYNLVVKAGETTLVAEDYTPVVSDAKDTLTITFDYDAQYAGQGVVITYIATVGDVTSGKLLKNNVKSEIAKGATEYEVVSDTVTFTVEKVDEENSSIKLKEAEFTLYVEDEAGTEIVEFGGKEINVSFVEAKETEDVTGQATFDGLDAQKVYYVKETKAPAGYSLNNEVYKLERSTANDTESTVNSSYELNGATIKVTTTTYTFGDFSNLTIEDTKLIALPSTGGIGTTIFTVAGCGIMIAAAFFFFTGRKKEEN